MAARVHPSPRPERKKRATRSCAHLTVVASGGEAIAPQRGANITPYGLLRSLRASLAASRPPPMAAPRRGACRPPTPRWLRPLARPERPRRHPFGRSGEEGEGLSDRGGERECGQATGSGGQRRSRNRPQGGCPRLEGGCPHGKRRGRESPRRPRRGRAATG